MKTFVVCFLLFPVVFHCFLDSERSEEGILVVTLVLDY